ncbi:sarcosine oxidase subunit delta [Chachezhania antarctica]|uniref:sarcosine oxidase subunit delta n=1 Tax=Chachezhania antarctica TaxID=2340860 RepID=UPI000EB193DB|nr:sarcosine oxidase subunit delta [Chachezhania antarctica]|tara:strand:- start:7566 stop:7826 length:261 start_codon:yes stop_codon:yes gene_type:complete
MRLPCPICGPRDSREFIYRGTALDRPAPDAGTEAWEEYLHLRDNPAGPIREFWYHHAGCTAWIEVTRNTATHEISDAVLAGGEGAA